MKIGRKYFEIEEEEVKVGSVGDAEEVSTEETEEKNEIEPLDDAVVNEVKTTKRGRKAKGAEQ